MFDVGATQSVNFVWVLLYSFDDNESSLHETKVCSTIFHENVLVRI
jgi:hypothetical protein